MAQGKNLPAKTEATIQPSLVGFCHCGCGAKTNISKTTDHRYGASAGEPRRYLPHHCHPLFKGGKAMSRGYVYILNKEHPRSIPSTGYVFEHLFVVEKTLGRYLKKGEEVHHFNGKKSDNMHRNLIVCQDRSYHKLIEVRTRAFLATGDPQKRKCNYCKQYDDISNLRKHRHKETYIHPQCDSKRAVINKKRRKENGNVTITGKN